MGRPPCCDKSNVKRGLWTPEEDAKILAYVANHGVGNWTLVPKKAGLNRCGKSCRLRWTNYLRPDLKHDSFTPEEEELIINLHKVVGSRWSFIAKKLPGRTDNDVKNFWNTKLRKKLWSMGIDHVTHKPFPQIFSDYGKISGLLITPNQDSNRTSELKIDPTSVLTEHPNPKTIMNPILNQNYESENHLTSKAPTWGFLASQFQIIQQETIHPYFHDEVMSSSSSSSSSSSTTSTQLSSPSSYNFQPSQDQTKPSCPFVWDEFLLGEPIQQQEESNIRSLLPSPEPATFLQNEISGRNFVSGIADNSYTGENDASSAGERTDFSSQAASASGISFVESLLDRDSKIRSQFPELSCGFFEY